MDGLELLAAAYGWPPSVGMDMTIDDYAAWTDRAKRWLKAKAQA